jgi:effector-binding domain-containing protein
MWEHYLYNFSNPEVQADYERVKGILTDSKKDLMSSGYEDIAIDDFYTSFLDQFKKIEEV